MQNSRVLPNALDAFDEIMARLRQGRPAVFLDYDGTLTPIVERPELAVLAPAVRQTLRELAPCYPVTIVSGRGLDDVRALVDLDQLTYAGGHGFHIQGPAGSGLRHSVGESFRSVVDRAEAALRHRLQAVSGSLVERKDLSVAIHFRQVSSDARPTVSAAVDTILEQLAGPQGLRKTHGKCVIELVPDIEWHKGHAVRWVIDALETKTGPVVPLYIGDDVTDENAFGALAEQGVGIVVTDVPRDTAATYTLQDTDEVHQLLRRLVGAAL